MQKRFVICDSDRCYTQRFLNVAQERLEQEFSIYVYEDIDKLKELLAEKAAEIVLISQLLYEHLKKEERSQISHIFLLCEEPSEEKHKICRYQAADAILRQIFHLYAEHVEQLPTRHVGASKNIHFIGIYTPIGRCLQTTFAVTLGQLLARDHKTLYLNFEGFSGLRRVFQDSPGYNMMDFVYFYDCAREKFLYRLEHMVQTMNGLDFVSPFESYMELSSITGGKWKEIFHYLEEQSPYEYVVLDLSEQMNGLLDILRFCEKVYTITKEDGFALAKMEQYEQMLRGMDYEDVWEKTIRRKLPVFRQIPAHIEQFTYGDVADYTRNLLREDWGYGS